MNNEDNIDLNEKYQELRKMNSQYFQTDSFKDKCLYEIIKNPFKRCVEDIQGLSLSLQFLYDLIKHIQNSPEIYEQLSEIDKNITCLSEKTIDDSISELNAVLDQFKYLICQYSKADENKNE